MANTLLLKRSSVAGKAPTTANLQYGELSLNYTDGTLYFKTNVNTIGSFVSNGSSLTANVLTITGGIFWANGAVYSSGGSGSSTTSTTAPTSPSVGDNWYNPSTDIVYRYTYDGTSYYWVDISGPGVANITSVYGNANVASYLPTYTSNITAANVTVSAGIYSPGYFYANGQPFTSSSYGNTNVAGYLPTYTGNIGGNIGTGNLTVYGNLSVTGNITTVNYETITNTEYVQTLAATNINAATIGNASAVLYGTLNSSSANQTNITAVGTLGNLTVTGNITSGNITATHYGNVVGTTNGNAYITGSLIPTANIAYDIGTTTQRFRSLYLSGNTIDLGGVTISAASGNITVGGQQVTTTATVAAYAGPKITSVQVTDSSYTVTSATAVSASGGYIVINGSNFTSGAQVVIGTKTATSIGFVSATQLRAQVPAQTNGTYVVYVTNPDGGVAINVPGLIYNDFPVWSSGSSLSPQVQGNAISIQLASTDSTTVTYSLASGSSLPSGLSLSSSGLLSGTVTGLSVTTVYNFTINAVDVYTQVTAQAFTITISVGDTYWANTTLLLSGDGTNGAQNNTFLDSSSNAFTVTRNGTPTQGSFSPYGSLWSNYFNGTSGSGGGPYLSCPNSSTMQFGSGSFTIEAWCYFTVVQESTIIARYPFDNTNNEWIFQTSSSLVPFFAYSAAGLNTGIIPVTSGSALSINTWYHLAVVKNGTGVTLYINGTSVSTGTISGSIYSGTTTTTIGCYAQSAYPGGYAVPNGYLSNVRVVKGSAVYTSNFTPTTQPLTAITNTQLLTCQSNRFIDNSSNAFAITVNGTPSVQRFSPFTSGTSYSASTIGGSGYFSTATPDSISIPNNSGMNFGTGDFTVEAWMYLTSGTGSYYGQQIIGKSNGSTGWAFLINRTSSGYGLGTTTADGTALGIYNTTYLLANVWYHVAWTRSTSTAKLFLNGVQVASATDVTNDTNTNTLWVASQANNGSGQNFPGYITDARIVKGTAVYTSNFTLPTAPLSAVSNTSVLLKMQNAGIVDSTMQNDFITIGSAQISTSVKKYGTGSISFNGSNSILQSYSLQSVQFGSGNWTVEFWVNFNSFSGAQVFVNFGYESTSTRSFIMYVSSGSYQIAQSTDGTTNYDQTLVATSLSTGTWYHFAYVRNSGTITFYINGTSSGTATAYSLSKIPTTWSIGSDNTNFLNGYIDDLRITKGYARYTSNFTPSTTAFIGQ